MANIENILSAKYKPMDIIMHKNWGACQIIKVIDSHGYCVQSSKKKAGEYLNVDDWDFVDNGIIKDVIAALKKLS